MIDWLHYLHVLQFSNRVTNYDMGRLEVSADTVPLYTHMYQFVIKESF